MEKPFNTNITPAPENVDKCPFCGMMELHIHIYYETDEELQEYLDSCGTIDTATGKKVIYEKVAPGMGTASMFDAVLGPIMDVLCDYEIDWEKIEE